MSDSRNSLVATLQKLDKDYELVQREVETLEAMLKQLRNEEESILKALSMSGTVVEDRSKMQAEAERRLENALLSTLSDDDSTDCEPENQEESGLLFDDEPFLDV